MATPKSKSKFERDAEGTYRLVYESNVDAVEYYIHELTRAALRDVGKYVVKLFKTSFYEHFKKHSGDAGRATRYKVISNARTTAPRIQIGLKTGQVDGFYAYFQEFGTSTGIPRLSILTKSVQEHIAEIIRIESQYLSGLSGEAAALEGLIDEDDYEGDADGDD